MKNRSLLNIGFQAGALVVSLVVTTLLLVAAGAPPLEAYASILKGAFGSVQNVVVVLITWSPLLLTTAGVLITFAAGLWNIGVEGQMVLGAIFATWGLRLLQDSTLPPTLIIVVAMLFGIVGGALWAGLAGVLKTFGGVNEIFGGLGLDFVATALTIYLVFGPWKRPGVGSMSGTQPFPERLWLPTLPGTGLSPWGVGLALLAVVLVYLMLRGTYLGLKLKAVGHNMRAAFLLGVPTWQYSMFSFLLSGAITGLAGAIQVAAVYHRLLPNISNGYGWLGLLVAMLINYQAVWVIPIAFFFAAINAGSVQLQILYKLDSSFGGVLQDLLVLFVLLGQGVRERLMRRPWEQDNAG
jgi:ABC-type uncharacterized transport system permease subunit